LFCGYALQGANLTQGEKKLSGCFINKMSVAMPYKLTASRPLILNAKKSALLRIGEAVFSLT
jgi:hypothetical protein